MKREMHFEISKIYFLPAAPTLLFPGRYPARAMPRIFIRGPHPRKEALPYYYSVTRVIERGKKREMRARDTER